MAYRSEIRGGPKPPTYEPLGAGVDEILSPFLRAMSGDDVRYTNVDELWDDNDPEAIDPWKWDGWIGEGVESREGGTASPQRIAEIREQEELNRGGRRLGKLDFQLPDEPDPGLASADRTAVARGVNPGRKDGGTGHMLDLAKTFIGTPYVFGAAGPSAFDCSGFVKYLYSRVYGVSLPHQAKQQAEVTRRIKRDELQPGDLIFYRYGRLGSEIDHVEIYLGGGRQIGTSNPTEDLDIDSIDWDNVVSFGRVDSPNIARGGGGGDQPVADPRLGKPKQRVKETEVRGDAINAPALLTGEYGEAAFSTVLAEVLSPPEVIREARWKTPKSLKGDSVKGQLYRGFLDAGRPDLARMVGTKDFQQWVQQESGWNPGATSPANNNGLRNDGLFQVWRGHAFNSRGQVAQMSPYEQAMLVAKHFDLTVQDIRTYAAQIRADNYHGWG